MFSAFANSLKIPELRQRILFTFALVFLCRILTSVPAPGVDPSALKEFMGNIQQSAGGNALAVFNMFSGGALQKFAVGSLGIMPYISASIILQLLTAVVPSLERLRSEGDVGRQKINQYTRYLTLLLCAVQGFALARLALNPAALQFDQPLVVMKPGNEWLFVLLTVISLTAATMLMMWLGEQITERGIGNGVSLIITVNIIGSLPMAVTELTRMVVPETAGGVPTHSIFHVAVLLVLFFAVTMGTVALTQGTRRIPVQYAKRMVGRKQLGGQSTYMPLRVNYSGVMPIIFAQAILMFPAPVFGYLGQKFGWDFMQRAAGVLNNPAHPVYILLSAVMILFFSYFWVSTQFNPVQISDDLKRNAGYIPGIKPGKSTAEFLDTVMTRITLAGALALTFLAIFPGVLAKSMGISYLAASFFGGTSLLIIVGVMLDTMRQIESHLLNRHYDGFLRKGKLRGRR